MTLAFDEHCGAGATVVCLPMFGASRLMTAAALRPALAGAGLRELYVDIPGHGDSVRSHEATSQAVLDAVAGFIDKHSVGSVLVAGCSYGGYLAAGLARLRPELVRALLLVCPGVVTAPEARQLPEAADVPSEPGWLDAAPEELRSHFDLALGRRTRAVVAEVCAALDAGGPGDEQYQDELRDGGGFPLPDEDSDARFGGPVAVVAGRQDRIVGFRDQYRSMVSYPRGTFVIADLAGHYLPFEQPELLRTTAQEWLQRCGHLTEASA